MPIFRITDDLVFPDPRLADDGLLAVGGDLSHERLLLAYRHGIFPWYSAGEPILWWSPDPRMILLPKELHVSQRLRRTIRQGVFRVTLDTAFPEVIHACARVPRKHEKGTWITAAMTHAYIGLHHEGYAHSVECWRGNSLVGGLYGLSLGACFFGESMFSRESNASKVAIATLAAQLEQWGIDLIDCQVANPHLFRLGGREIPRDAYLVLLRQALRTPTRRGAWTFAPASSPPAQAAPEDALPRD
jgi:leucyl/phenylalanyl-tRNA--protein transferase